MSETAYEFLARVLREQNVELRMGEGRSFEIVNADGSCFSCSPNATRLYSRDVCIDFVGPNVTITEPSK